MKNRVWGGLWLSGLLALAACGGGGGDAGTCSLGCDGGSSGTTVADLIVTLDKQSLTNSGSDAVTATVQAVDASRVVVSGATVSVGVDSQAVVVASSATTDSDGKVVATIGVGEQKANRVITFTANSGTVRRTTTLSVTGSAISASLASSVVPGSTGNTIRYRVVDVNANALVGQTITVSAPGLTGQTGTTSSNGEFDFVYTAPTTAGALTLTATAAGVSNTQVVQVQDAAGGVPVAVGPVSSASVSANPKTVGVNTAGSSSNQTQIRALFQGDGNAPIANVRVRFDLNGDPNAVGGSLSSGTNLLYSTADGVVTAAYIPGTRSSPTDGVTVRACWDYDTFPVGSCPNQVSVQLTVTAEPVSVTLGTNELIGEGDAGLTYTRQFVVMVVDSAGVAQEGVTISPLIDLTAYAKGAYSVTTSGTGSSATSRWTASVQAVCTNEDSNRNAVLNTDEDVNGNGVLEPRKADVSIRMVDSNKTDASGIAILQIEYPKSVASWVDFLITVSASGISGTEGSASIAGSLSVPASAINTTTSSPAFVVSPYGTSASCTSPD